MIVNAASLTALFTSLKANFNKGFESAPSMWERLATLIPSAGKSNDYAWMGKFPRLREWIGEKEVQNLTLQKYNIPNRDWEATVEVDRNDIEDDNVGVYVPVVQMAGYSARTFPDENVFPLLAAGFSEKCHDGKTFFSETHKVGRNAVSNMDSGSGDAWYLLDVSKPIKPLIYQERKAPTFLALDDSSSESVFRRKSFLYSVEARGAFGFSFWQLAYGSKKDLTLENYAAARAAMMSFTDEENRPLNVQPGLLVVPPSLEAKARDILLATQSASGATNTWYKSAELLVSPWLG